jgi:hypothetical protein
VVHVTQIFSSLKSYILEIMVHQPVIRFNIGCFKHLHVVSLAKIDWIIGVVQAKVDLSQLFIFSVTFKGISILNYFVLISWCGLLILGGRISQPICKTFKLSCHILLLDSLHIHASSNFSVFAPRNVRHFLHFQERIRLLFVLSIVLLQHRI